MTNYAELTHSVDSRCDWCGRQLPVADVVWISTGHNGAAGAYCLSCYTTSTAPTERRTEKENHYEH